MTGLIIYSRLNSKRLPGKALLKIGGAELIKIVHERAKKINADKIIVATSKERTDDALVDFLKKEKISYFRGDLEDVALRTIQCIDKYKMDSFIRINGDSPLFPVREMNESLGDFKNHNFDFLTNLLPRTYPYGYSLEIFDSKIFSENYNDFNTTEREHITTYFYRNKNKFNFKNIENQGINYSNNIFLTVDDNDSFNFMNEFFNEHSNAANFEFDEIVKHYYLIKDKQIKPC